MLAPSFVLLSAGAVTSLAGLWWLAGLSERSSLSSSPRVVAVAVVGVVGLGGAHYGTPAALRGELLLPALFGLVSVLSLAVGTAKLEGALQDRDGPRALRRAAGLLTGTFLSMAALAAASLELAASSVSHARLGWMHVLPLVVGVLLAFVQRVRLAGNAARSLGRLGLVLGILGLLALLAARYAVVPRARASAAPESPRTVMLALPSEQHPVSASAGAPSEDPIAIPAPLVSPSASALAAPDSSAAPAPSAPVSLGAYALHVTSVDARGMMEADARGGVMRRFTRLEACLAAEPARPAGELTLKIGIDSSGSVNYAKVTAGDLAGSPLANCLLPVFYKMGFASPRSGAASFRITLRAGRAHDPHGATGRVVDRP